MSFGKPRCPVCGNSSPGDFLPCEYCRESIEYRYGEYCSHCGRDLAGSDDPCTSCRINESLCFLKSMAGLGEWQGALREWLSIYKYGGDIRMADYLAEQLARRARESWPDVPIVPVPPRKKRMRQNGFDPVGTLGRRLADRGFSVCRILERRGGGTQKGRSREERLSSGALDYRLKKSSIQLRGTWLLLDDVSTTGATLETCASVLREAGAQTVYGLIVAWD